MHCNFICGLSDVIIKTFSQSISHSRPTALAYSVSLVKNN